MDKPERRPHNFEQAKALLQDQSQLESLAQEKRIVMGYAASIRDAFATDVYFQVKEKVSVVEKEHHLWDEICFNSTKIRKYSYGGYDYVYCGTPLIMLDELKLKPVIQPYIVPKKNQEWHFDSFPLGGTQIASARPIAYSNHFVSYVIDGKIIDGVGNEVRPLIIDLDRTPSLHAREFKANFIFDKNKPYYGRNNDFLGYGSPYNERYCFFSNASLFFNPNLTSKIDEYWKYVVAKNRKDWAKAMVRFGFLGGAGMLADYFLYDRVTPYLPSALAHIWSFAAGFMGTTIASLLIGSAINKRIHPHLWREDTPLVIDDSILEDLGMYEHTTEGKGLYDVLMNNPPIFMGEAVN